MSLNAYLPANFDEPGKNQNADAKQWAGSLLASRETLTCENVP